MKLAALVLAAGAGRRFGGGKLAAPFRGDPLLAHAIRAALAAPAARVVVVAAPELDCGAWPDRVEIVRLASDSLSASLQAGLAVLDGADGVFVFLGDMPLIPHDLAGQLAAALGDHYAALPRHQGQPGHPVLLSRRAMVDAAQLSGDAGAGRLLRAQGDVAFIDDAAEGVVLDVDRAQDLARLEGNGA